MQRLPTLPTSTDRGCVYVVQRGETYKIGFTREGLKRRVRACDGVLVLTIRTRPATSIARAGHTSTVRGEESERSGLQERVVRVKQHGLGMAERTGFVYHILWIPTDATRRLIIS